MTLKINGVEMPVTDEMLTEAVRWARLEYRAAVEALTEIVEDIADTEVDQPDRLGDVALEADNVAKFARNLKTLREMEAEA